MKMFAILLLLPCLGCATLLTPDNKQVTFNSRPSGALIQVGPYECTTPGSLLIPKGQQYSITARFENQKQVLPLTQSIDKITFFNVLFPPGFFLDAITDKIQKYSPKEYMFEFNSINVQK